MIYEFKLLTVFVVLSIFLKKKSMVTLSLISRPSFVILRLQLEIDHIFFFPAGDETVERNGSTEKSPTRAPRIPREAE